MTVLLIDVLGTPVPQGSKVALRGKGQKHANVVDSNKATLRPWRELVHEQARLRIAEWELRNEAPWRPFDGPLLCILEFRFDRPKSHPVRRRTWPTAKNDLDKLVRAVFDALTTSATWVDDGRVTDLHARKRWCVAGELPGVHITVSPADVTE